MRRILRALFVLLALSGASAPVAAQDGGLSGAAAPITVPPTPPISAQTAVPRAGQERILLFISDVHVQRNGNLEVTETIRVQVEGREIRRGILRDFPTSYSARDGSRVRVGFQVLSVMRDGRHEAWRLEDIANGVRIRIGRASHLLTLGVHEYVIRYRTTRQLGFFKNFDELYWNATGNGWTFAIDEAEARITLPQEVPFTQSAFYTGPQGARGKDAEIVAQRPGRIVFRTTRPLPRNNGLTIAAAWEKGVIAEPTPEQKAEWWWQDNRLIVASGAGLVLVLAIYLLGWMVVGRDPPRGTIIPLFAPPDDMSPAAVRYVYNMHFDNRAFTAAIIDLAVKGHLKIEDSGNDTRIRRNAGKGTVAPAEQATYTQLFKSSSSLLLDNKNHKTIGKARTLLQKGLKKAYLGKMFTNNLGWSVTGFIAAVVFVGVIIAGVLADYSPATSGGFLAAMLIPLIPLLVGLGMVAAGRERGGTFNWLATLGALVTIITGGLGIFFMWMNVRGWVEVAPGLAVWTAAPLALWGFRWMQAPSTGGRAIMDRIEGFKQYLEVAEEDRLEYLHPPKKTPELFERFLPYAVALNVENSWAQKFASVLAAAGTEAAVATWYAGRYHADRDPVGFVDRIGSSLSSTISSASSAPGSSSGSGGGGSSGGGGGGGGGSGW